jgi:hypothetical protein
MMRIVILGKEKIYGGYIVSGPTALVNASNSNG